MSETGRNLMGTVNTAGRIAALLMAIVAFAAMWETDLRQTEQIRLARLQRQHGQQVSFSSAQRSHETADTKQSRSTKLAATGATESGSATTFATVAAMLSDRTGTEHTVTETAQKNATPVASADSSGMRKRNRLWRRARKRAKAARKAARNAGARPKDETAHTADVEAAFWALVDTVRQRLSAGTEGTETVAESSRSLPVGIRPGVYRVVDRAGRVETIEVTDGEGDASTNSPRDLYSLETDNGPVYFIRQSQDRLAGRPTDVLR